MQVVVTGLQKLFGPKVGVDIPALQIAPGETFGLVGSNGAGKTTFLRLLLDLLKPSAGMVTIDGQSVATSANWKSSTGSYLDESFLLDFLTADEFFEFIGDVYGLRQDALASELKKYQSFYPDEVFGHTDKLLRELSRGSAKKVGIIGAMITRPGLLILDEPFANLDPGSQILLKQLITDLNEKHGTTAIVSSHDLLHVTDICRRIAVLDKGRIVRDIETSTETLRNLQAYFTSSDAPIEAPSNGHQGGVPTSTRR